MASAWVNRSTWPSPVAVLGKGQGIAWHKLAYAHGTGIGTGYG